jgi:hypothetical protein
MIGPSEAKPSVNRAYPDRLTSSQSKPPAGEIAREQPAGDETSRGHPLISIAKRWTPPDQTKNHPLPLLRRPPLPHILAAMQTKPPPKKPQTLKPKDVETITALGYYKWMTAEQIQRLVYPNAKDYHTATKRLTELACTYNYEANAFLDDGYISYGLIYDKASPRMGRPKRYFFLTTPNLHNIAEAYKRRGNYAEFTERFADVTPIESKNGFAFSLPWMQHELAITDYALALHAGTTDPTPLFWERTSKNSKHVMRKYKVTKPNPKDASKTVALDVNVNPDCVECIAGEIEDNKTLLYLACGEIDRNTESLEAEFLPKIYAYDAFIKERHMEAMLSLYITRYHLTALHPYLASPRNYRCNFRIRIVTTAPERRNDIIRLIAHYSQYPTAYHVTILDALADWPTFYTAPLWYPASDYEPIRKRERETKQLRPRAVTQWRHEQITTHMTPVPYFYRARQATKE